MTEVEGPSSSGYQRAQVQTQASQQQQQQQQQQMSAVLPMQLEEVQRQVDQVVQVMKKNIEGIERREQNLNELELRAETLNQQSVEFATTSQRIQRKMLWENRKWTLIAIGTATLVLSIIAISLAIKFS